MQEKHKHVFEVLNWRTECLEMVWVVTKRGERRQMPPAFCGWGTGANVATRGPGPHQCHPHSPLRGTGKTSSHQLPYLTKGWAGAGCWVGGEGKQGGKIANCLTPKCPFWIFHDNHRTCPLTNTDK